MKTPRTDDLARGNHVVPTEWAEHLERELYEANKELHKQLVRYDQLFDEAEKIRIERDEALMDRANGDIATMTINHYERILRERDEARELLRILAGLVAYGLGQSGEEWSLEAMRQATSAIQNAKSLEESK